MASFNKVILVGNLCKTPELRSIPSGTQVCDVSIAVNDKRKNAAGEWIEEVTFVDVTFWGKTAEVLAKYLDKGSPILVEGRLKLDKWEDKDGQKRSKLRVVCERMQMIGSKGEGGQRKESEPSAPPRDASEAPTPSESGTTYNDDNLPF